MRRVRMILEKLAGSVALEPVSQVAAPAVAVGKQQNIKARPTTSAPIGPPACSPSPGIEERVRALVHTVTAPQSGRWTNDPIEQAQKMLVQIGRPAVEPLIAALGEPLGQFKLIYVIEPLGKIADPRAVDALLKLTNHPSEYVRRAVVGALGVINDPRGIHPLIQALHDSDKSVRAYAAEGLGIIGGPRAVEPLIVALDDGDADVRLYAVRSLDLLKDIRAVEPLIAVSVNDTVERVRTKAREALKKIDPSGLERAQKESAKLAVSVSPDGRALYEKLHSGKAYGEENPIALAGTEAQVCFRSRHIGEKDRWILSIPTGFHARRVRRIPIDIEQNPDQAVCALLEKSKAMQVGLQAEGKIYNLIHGRSSEDAIDADNPIIVGNLAYIFMAPWDKAYHLRVPVSHEAERDFVIPEALLASERLDKWVLDTMAAAGLSLMKERFAQPV